LTPYIGGGLGAAELMTSNVHFINPDGSTGSWPNGERWNFAWSLTAGVSYPITKNFLIDANYRFVDLGRPFPARPARTSTARRSTTTTSSPTSSGSAFAT
jgi:opacity protein-like surface antigen